MKLGIVGLPNVGKSTLFNSITKAGAECANYPFCTIEPNVGVVAVPDERLDKLTEITKYYYSIMPLNCTFPKITIKDVKSKWGSYNKVKHEIIYSSELVFKDEHLYSYLVVHELAHILEFNHSSRFYDIVGKYCPNYKVLRKMLKEW